MYRSELQKLEGVWTGTERVTTAEGAFEATGRYEFRTLFEGRFLVCDYVQTAPDRPTSVAHGVFRKDEKTSHLTVSWFRDPGPTNVQQGDGVAEADKLAFVETIGSASTRTTYAVALNRLSITTERKAAGNDWETVFEGSYKRPRG